MKEMEMVNIADKCSELLKVAAYTVLLYDYYTKPCGTPGSNSTWSSKQTLLLLTTTTRYEAVGKKGVCLWEKNLKHLH